MTGDGRIQVTHFRQQQGYNCSMCSNQTYLHRLQFRRVENGRGSKDVRLRSAHFVSGDGGSEALKGRRRMEMGVVGRHIGGSGVAG